jgi:hypothetical protein
MHFLCVGFANGDWTPMSNLLVQGLLDPVLPYGVCLNTTFVCLCHLIQKNLLIHHFYFLAHNIFDERYLMSQHFSMSIGIEVIVFSIC